MSARDARATVAGPGSSREAALAIETLVARILVAGTWGAIGLVLVGVAGMLATGVDPLVTTSAPFDASQILADLVALRPEGFLWAGLVLVLVLPIGRVVVSGAGFLAARDRQLALVSLAVLLVVLLSVAAALGLEG